MRYLRNTGIVIFGIAIVITVILAVMAIIFHNLFNTQLAKLASSGKYSSLADFKPIKVPDDQNAAVIYTQMINQKPKISIFDPNKTSDPLRLGIILKNTKGNKNQEMCEEARTIINRNRKIYEQLDEATKKPYCVFPVDWSQETAYLNGSQFRDYSRFLCAKAVLDARDGKPDHLHSIYTCIKMSESLGTVPNTASQENRNVILKMVCDNIVRSLEYRDLSEQDVVRLRQTLSQINLKDSLTLAFKRDRLLMRTVSPEYVLPKSLVDSITLSANPPDRITGMTCDAFHIYYRNVGQYGDKVVWLNYMDKVINGMDLSYRDAVKQGIFDPQFPFYATMCDNINPTYSMFQVDRYIAESQLSGTDIILALHAYRNRYGSYPSNLDELRSKLGWDIPVDPLSGKDFKYRTEGKGFILYSIGEDLKDDGGIDYYARDNYFKQRGDIVWKLDR